MTSATLPQPDSAATKNPTKHFPLEYAAVFFIALIVLTTITEVWGPSKKFFPGGDSEQYMSLGRSLASGRGYKDTVGPWPDRPACDRMPGWPALIALGVIVAPHVAPEAVVRFTNVFCLCIAGVFFCGVCRRLRAGPIFSALAALGVSLSPMMVSFMVAGISEISFVMIIAIGLTCILAEGSLLYIGAFILGTAALVRTNFVLVPVAFCGLALLSPSGRHSNRMNLRRLCLACIIALVPSSLWVVRNAFVTHRFPVLSSIEGETLYGSNNDVVAGDLQYWGFWVVPDQIPGEIPKEQLARDLGSSLALSNYYHRQAISWIEANLRSLPRLELGKFVRAFVPIPWVPLTISYIAFFCRFILYVLCLALLRFWWPVIDRIYLLFCSAMLAVHIITTAIYYGSSRFTFCWVELFLLPCIALGLDRWWALRRQRGLHRGATAPSPVTT
jgi:hypothetical protein